MNKILLGFAALSLLAAASDARAQEVESFATRAPRNAFEISVAPAYTQGTGSLDKSALVSDISHAGFGATLGLGWRVNPTFMAGASGQYQEFIPNEKGASTRGVAFGLDATLHVRPFERADPWVQLGAGYRGIWSFPIDAPMNAWHGFELAKLRLGVDLRLLRDLAVAPYFGADIDTLAWKDAGDGRGLTPVDGVRASLFFETGILARFDVAGVRPHAPTLGSR